MNLEKKKTLAAKTLGVGKERIIFNTERFSEIKEAITKQDIRDLYSSHAIFVKDIHGRRTIVKRKNRRRKGSIRKMPKKSKRKYIVLTRKLRAYLFELRRKELLAQSQYLKLRKQIKAGMFKDKNHFKEFIAGESK